MHFIGFEKKACPLPVQPAGNLGLVKGAALKNNLRVIVCGRKADELTGKAGRRCSRHQMLGNAFSGLTGGSYLPVAPGLSAYPGHRIVSVLVVSPAIVQERPVLTLGVKASPHILYDNGVLVSEPEQRLAFLPAVGCPDQEHRPGAPAVGRQVYISGQLDLVSHGNHVGFADRTAGQHKAERKNQQGHKAVQKRPCFWQIGRSECVSSVSHMSSVSVKG